MKTGSWDLHRTRHAQGFIEAICAGDCTKTAISFLATPRKPRLHRNGKGDGVACKKLVHQHVIDLLIAEQ